MRMRAPAAAAFGVVAAAFACAALAADPPKWETRRSYDQGTRIVAVAESPDGSLLATAATDGKIRLVASQGGNVRHMASPGGKVVELSSEVVPLRDVLFAGDGKLVAAVALGMAAVGERGTSRISVWSTADVATGRTKPLRVLDYADQTSRVAREEPGRGGVIGASPLGSGRLFVEKALTAGEVVDAATGKHVRDVAIGPKTTAAAVSPDATRYLRADARGGVDGGSEITVIDLTTGKELWGKITFAAPKKTVVACDGLRVLRDGKSFAATWERLDAKGLRTAEGVAVIDLATGDVRWTKEIVVPEADGGDRVRIANVAPGDAFLAVLAGFEVTVLALADGAEETTLKLSDQNVTALAAGRDGRTLWLGGFRGLVTEFRRGGGVKMDTSPDPADPADGDAGDAEGDEEMGDPEQDPADPANPAGPK